MASIALQNKRIVYTILFRATAETLSTIAADAKHLGAQIERLRAVREVRCNRPLERSLQVMMVMGRTEATKVGRYEIVDRIGSGSMGVIYLARDPLIGRLIALKVCRFRDFASDDEAEQFRMRFIREAQSAGILSHPNVVAIHDVGGESEEGSAFIAMEYVRGTNLEKLLQGDEPLEHDFIVKVVSQVADALDYAHSMEVVHRDIKPANIMITSGDQVKITDFGIARLNTSNLTRAGQLLGTPSHMAPEVLRGREGDHRADIFSIGVVLYELITKRPPFDGERLEAVTHRIIYEPYTPPDEYVANLPPGLNRVLARALEKDPANRYQRAVDLATDLRKVHCPPAQAAAVSLKRRLGPLLDAPASFGFAQLRRISTAVVAVQEWIAQAVARGREWTFLALVQCREWLRANRVPVWRPAALAACAALLGGLLNWSMLSWVDRERYRPWSDAAEHQRQLQFVRLVRTGHTYLQQNDWEGAVSAFGRAERLAPERAGIRQLRERAEEARTEAQEEEELSRPAKRQPPAAESKPSAPAPAAGPRDAAAEAAAAAVAAEAFLDIDFQTELPKGVLTIYADGEEILREPFQYMEKSDKKGGGFQRRVEWATGATTIEVDVKLKRGPLRRMKRLIRGKKGKGKPDQVLAVPGDPPEGRSHTLEIRVSPAGEVTAALSLPS